eukprot:2236734-Rhodomonas_salina.4
MTMTSDRGIPRSPPTGIEAEVSLQSPCLLATSSIAHSLDTLCGLQERNPRRKFKVQEHPVFWNVHMLIQKAIFFKLEANARADAEFRQCRVPPWS